MNSRSSGSAVAEEVAEMPNEHLHEPFIDGIKDIYNAEKQLLTALPKMIKGSTSAALKEGLSNHLKETEGHVTRLEKVFESINEKAKGKTCQAMKGLVEEGGEAIKENDEPEARDAAIIMACQKVEHYEIATYGTLRRWAEAMGHDRAAELLEETLNEEKAADEKLTQIAEEECECSSAHAGGSSETEEEEEE